MINHSKIPSYHGSVDREWGKYHTFGIRDTLFLEKLGSGERTDDPDRSENNMAPSTWKCSKSMPPSYCPEMNDLG